MKLIWATRGRAWGFRFLRDGGFDDPLPEYERAFSGISGTGPAWHRREQEVAFRLADPLGRQDRAGRTISHDFVVFGHVAERVESVDDGLREIWPAVVDQYEQVWNLPASRLSEALARFER